MCIAYRIAAGCDFPLSGQGFLAGNGFPVRRAVRSFPPQAGFLRSNLRLIKSRHFPPKTGDGVGFAALSDGRITTITAGMDMRRRYHRIPPQRQRFNIGLNQLLNLRRIVAAACS